MTGFCNLELEIYLELGACNLLFLFFDISLSTSYHKNY